MAEIPAESCCPSSLPPVTTHDYTPKGNWETLAGINVYITSPSSPTRAILAVYDIFGAVAQTMQGSDRISAATNAAVFMPDFFEGEPISMSLYPPNTEEKKKSVAGFMSTKAALGPAGEKLLAVVAAAKEKPHWRDLPWGGYGLCWGGKVTALHSAKDTPFKASGQAHPGRLVVEDAKAITIPHICLFSKEDGSPELCEEYGKALKERKENVVDKYGTMVHGWMGARSNLEDPEVVKNFEKGYTQLAEFFAKHV